MKSAYQASPTIRPCGSWDNPGLPKFLLQVVPEPGKPGILVYNYIDT